MFNIEKQKVLVRLIIDNFAIQEKTISDNLYCFSIMSSSSKFSYEEKAWLSWFIKNLYFSSYNLSWIYKKAAGKTKTFAGLVSTVKGKITPYKDKEVLFLKFYIDGEEDMVYSPPIEMEFNTNIIQIKELFEQIYNFIIKSEAIKFELRLEDGYIKEVMSHFFYMPPVAEIINRLADDWSVVVYDYTVIEKAGDMVNGIVIDDKEGFLYLLTYGDPLRESMLNVLKEKLNIYKVEFLDNLNRFVYNNKNKIIISL